MKPQLALTQTAARMTVSSVTVEKGLPGELAARAGVTDRFSEDIDLSMSPAFVGADESVFAAMKSRARRDAAQREPWHRGRAEFALKPAPD